MNLVNLLEDLPDTRRAQGKLYKLNHVLVCVVLSILCGGRSYRDVHRFIKIHLKKLNNLLGMNWKQAPTHSTLQEILSGIKKQALEWYFRQHSKLLDEGKEAVKNGTFVAIDGKSLRGSFDHMHDKGALNMISAYCTNNAFILGHIEASDKSNEIPAVQQLLNGFGLKGCVYTLDAMHCQKKPLKSFVPKKMMPLSKLKGIKKRCLTVSKT
jgi:hypothetical protein